MLKVAADTIEEVNTVFIGTNVSAVLFDHGTPDERSWIVAMKPITPRKRQKSTPEWPK